MLTPSNLTVADRARLREVIARLDRVVGAPCDDETLTRPNYFAGKVLGADDLRQEQDYHRSHRRRHNRLLHGIGVVGGLEVNLQPGEKGEDPAVVVSPGVAVSPEGDELVVCEPISPRSVLRQIPVLRHGLPCGAAGWPDDRRRPRADRRGGGSPGDRGDWPERPCHHAPRSRALRGGWRVDQASSRRAPVEVSEQPAATPNSACRR